jgi:thymidylate kinase
MLVAIEGMDGVGKTSVAKAIEESLNFIYIKDPLKELFDISQEHLMKILNKIFAYDDERIKAWTLALGEIYVLSQYKSKNVILDRHTLLNYYWNGTSNSISIFELENKLFGNPDLTIILYASTNVRIKRMKKRDPNDPDLLNAYKLENGYKKIEDFVIKNKIPYVLINTDNMTESEVIDKCKDLIIAL